LERDEFGDITEAIAREKEIKKKMTRARKIRLIESINPQWKDLSEEWKERDPGFPGRSRPARARPGNDRMEAAAERSF